MTILGIETSCDETSAAVVENGRKVLSNVTATSLKTHALYGGIIPEIASRRQLESISAVVQDACAQAKVRLQDVRALAVTRTPGLIGSLLVGNSFARALGLALRKPLIDVDHIQAHLYAAFLHRAGAKPVPGSRPRLPAVGLAVSGGHTALYAMPSFGKYKLLGETRDDAAGESFDKVAKILNLGYPGGPAIDRMAARVKECAIRFPQARLAHDLDFSFSGLKTSVLYYWQKNAANASAAQVAYAFQSSVVATLT